MNFAYFIAGRITFRSKRTFSKLIVRIAIVGIMLGLGVMILSLAVVKGFKNEIREKIRGFDGDIKVVKYDLNSSYENSPFLQADTFVKKAQHNNLIAHIMPFATKPGIIKAHNEIEGVVLKGVDSTYDWSFLKANLVAGSVINFIDTAESKRQIMISAITANRLKLKLGDHLLMYFVQAPLKRRPFTVVGIFDTSIEDIDKTYVVGDISLIKRLNDWKPGEIGGYELRVTSFDNIDAAARFVDNNLPTRLKSTTVIENYPTMFEWLNLLDVNTRVMLILMLIGMLKAMGATNWNIQKVFLYNAFYLISLGLIFGNIFGLGLSWLQYKTHFFKLDAASYYMTFVPIQLNWADVILLNLGTMLICLLVLIVPSMLVSKISPVKAIRFK